MNNTGNNEVCGRCDGRQLVRSELEPTLRGLRCEGCGVTFVAGEDYRNWLQHQPAGITTEHAQADEAEPAADHPRARTCVDCGRIMRRLLIAAERPFAIDRCACGGLWLDAGEWQTLRRLNLAQQIPHLGSAEHRRRALIETQAQQTR